MVFAVLLAPGLGSGQALADEKPSYEDPGFTGISGEEIRTSISGTYPERRPNPHVPFSKKPAHPGRAATVNRRQVPVELVEEAGLDRAAEPVRFGFPLPEGALSDPSQIRLLSPAGDEHPTQFTITGFWKDGSIKWLLVTFMADVKADAKAVYTIEFGSEVRRSKPEKPITLRQAASVLLVDTGPMRVRIDTKSFSLLDKVWLDADGDGRFTPGESAAESANGGIVMTDREGERYTSSAAPVEFRVEEQGPLTLGLRFEGPYSSADGKEYFRQITRLRFFAGSTIVGIAHSHVDDFLEHEFADFATAEMPFKAGVAREARFLVADSKGGVEWQTIPLGGGVEARLFQRDDAGFVLTGHAEMRGKRAPGVVELVGPSGVMMSGAVEDFWQNYPGAIRASADGLSIELWPDIRGVAEYGELPAHLRYPFVGGGYRFKWGMSKTHHLWLGFGGQSVAGLGVDGLIPVLPAAWYEETNALGPMVAKRPGEFEAWDEAFEKLYESHMARKESVREYGFFNWGDWHGERGTNWGNNEYDLPHGLFMQFARTGDRRYYRLALAGARHQADVDLVHAYPDPTSVGGQVVHGICHTGEWSETIEHRSWSTRYTWQALASNGHTWAEGMCDAWHLAGDARTMECAQALGEHVVYGMLPRFTRLGTHERSAGWALQAILALYRATRDPVYLDAARKIAEVALKEQDLDGSGVWPHPLPKGHCNHHEISGAEICVGNAPFLIAILCSGLKEYYLISDDPRAKRSLTAASPWWKKIWHPDANSFPYTTCPFYRDSASPLIGTMCADAVAYAYELTGDEEYLNMAARVFMTNVGGPPGGWGKSFGQFAQYTSRVMAILKEHEGENLQARNAVRMTSDDILHERLANGQPVAFVGVRSPEQKRFYVLNPEGEPCRIHIERKPHGSRAKDKPTGTVTVVGPGGEVVKRAEFSTDLPYQLDVDLPPAEGKRPYRVDISDDMRGVWDVAGDNARVVLDCHGEVSLANYKAHRVFFLVPAAAVGDFEIKLFAVHEGPFAAAVFDRSGEMRAMTAGNNASFGSPAGRGTIAVTVPKGSSGRLWSLVLLAGGDMNLRVDGIPPYLSRTPEGWFDPQVP